LPSPLVAAEARGFILEDWQAAMNDRPTSPQPVQESSPPAAVDSPRAPRDSWRSDELLGTRDEVFILHNNDVYRLRRTRQGKLILYK
jgi:hemin uptake protein HemP